MSRAGRNTEMRLNDVRRRERTQRNTSGWCILRTNGRRTLPLVASLVAAGIEAWSPREVRKRRLPRSRSFREYDEAIVPSFVFVRAEQLADVLRAHAQPVCPHPSFSVFQFSGRVPVIADASLSEMRVREDLARVAHEAAQQRAREAARRALRRTTPVRSDVGVGTSVRLADGAYAGLGGTVERIGTDEVVIRLNGQFPVTVASWLLLSAEVQDAEAPRGIAA